MTPMEERRTRGNDRALPMASRGVMGGSPLGGQLPNDLLLAELSKNCKKHQLPTNVVLQKAFGSETIGARALSTSQDQTNSKAPPSMASAVAGTAASRQFALLSSPRGETGEADNSKAAFDSHNKSLLADALLLRHSSLPTPDLLKQNSLCAAPGGGAAANANHWMTGCLPPSVTPSSLLMPNAAAAAADGSLNTRPCNQEGDQEALLQKLEQQLRKGPQHHADPQMAAVETGLLRKQQALGMIPPSNPNPSNSATTAALLSMLQGIGPRASPSLTTTTPMAAAPLAGSAPAAWHAALLSRTGATPAADASLNGLLPNTAAAGKKRPYDVVLNQQGGNAVAAGLVAPAAKKRHLG